MEMPLARSREVITNAVKLGSDRGAEVVGLGGFTSVVTRGGRSIANHVSVPLTTGNALTALSAVRAVEAVLGASDSSLATAMIFGAFGTIGAAVSKLLCRRVRQIHLIGKNGIQLQKRAETLRTSLLAHLQLDRTGIVPGSVASSLLAGATAADIIVAASDPGPYWKTSNLIVTATTALEELVKPDDLAPGTIVCDISRPINVSREITAARPDVVLIEGGVLKPHPPFDSRLDLGVGRHRAYACLAETMLLALEQDMTHTSLGQEIDMSQLPWLESAARRAGFRLSGWKGSEDVPIF
jgi:predicted amino acid dehydrogenase